jgi:glycosyltransferase involved in cell wall biosynthesis
VAGKGDYETTLKKMAGVSSNIRFLGHLPPNRMDESLRKSRALIIPSLCYEAFPLVAVEAFRSQTPVIARNLGGLAELVEESGGGMTYDTNEQLLTAMDRLIKKPADREHLGDLGYRAFRNKWTADVYLKGYFDLIDRITAAKISTS